MNKRKLLEKGYNLYCFLSSKIPEGYAPLPPVIIWEITYKCNLRCKMCVFYGKEGKLPESINELSFEEIKAVIDDLKKSYRFYPYKPFIGLIGGEPFIHPKIFEILEYLKISGFSYSVTTNFALLDEEKIDRLVKIGINDIRVSIDGPCDIHDEIRSVKGTFNKMMKNLRYLRSINKTIPLRINCVINPLNINRLHEIISYAKELDAHCSYQHLIFIDKEHIDANRTVSKNLLGEEIPCYVTSMNMSNENVYQLNDEYIEIINASKIHNVDISFTPDLNIEDFKKYYLDISGYVHNEKCFWPWGTGRINPEGDVYSCLYYKFGNVRNKYFNKIWNSDRARKFRHTLKRIQLFPGCIRCCKI